MDEKTELSIQVLPSPDFQSECSAPDQQTIEIAAPPFKPNAEFLQTCGACGSVFRVEIETAHRKDSHRTYCCPQCSHHECSVSSPKPPRVTLIRAGKGPDRHA